MHRCRRLKSVWGLLLLSLVAFGCTAERENVVTASDGVEIHFDRRGDGPVTLVFVHGWGNSRAIWEDQVALFSVKYEVVNIDLPGFGESGNDRKQFTIPSYADDVATVLSSLALERVVLVGFSMGALVVIEAANKAPETVVGVILVDGRHDVDFKTPSDSIGGIVKYMMDVVNDPTNEKLVSNGFYKRNEEANFNRISAMLRDGSRVGWEESLADAIRWGSENHAAAISRVRAPIMGIYTDLSPVNVEAFRKYAPEFQARIISDAGHVLMWDAPDEFNDVLEQSIQALSIEK